MARSKIAPHAMLCAVVLMTAVSACDGSGGAPAPSVRDSAGIRIVESSAPQWAEGEGWMLSAQPILEIGVMDGDDPYMFDGIMGVVRFEDGVIVVGNGGDATLRYFDSTGTHLTTAGGRGDGPAEINAMFSFGRLGNDVAAHQFRQPSKVFDRQGDFRRALQAPRVGLVSNVESAFADGSLLIATWPQGRTVRGDVYVDSAYFVRADLDAATTDTVAVMPAVHFVAIQMTRARRGYPQGYGPRPSTTMRNAHWYFGWSRDYEVRQLDADGTLRRLVRRAWEPIPVTSDDVQRYRDELFNAGTGGGPLPPQIRAQRQAIVDGMVYPEHHPAFERIAADRVGNLWVERSDPANPRRPSYGSVRDGPAQWDVFDPDGVWLGEVELPARFWVWEIGDEYVAGVSKDDVEVERIRVYGLVKPR